MILKLLISKLYFNKVHLVPYANAWTALHVFLCYINVQAIVCFDCALISCEDISVPILLSGTLLRLDSMYH